MTSRGMSNASSELDSNLHLLKNITKGHMGTDMTVCVTEVAQKIGDHCADDEDLKKQVRGIMLECIEMENEVKHYVDAINHIKLLDPGTPNLSAVLENKLVGLRQAQGDPLEHPKYVTLLEKMENSSPTDFESQLASLKATLLTGSQDDDIEMTESDINIKCPYSGKVMENPVINTSCKHVYDRDSIMEYISGRKKKAKCPVAGCGNSNPILARNLKDHTDLKKYIALISKNQ